MSPVLAGLELTPGSTPSYVVTYTRGPRQAIAFTLTGVPYVYSAGYFNREQLSYDAGTSEYRMLLPDGRQLTFDSNGKPLTFKDAGGNSGSYTYHPTTGDLQKIGIVSGSDSVEYAYTWTGTQVSEIVHSVNGRAVRKTTYGYSLLGLETVKIWENSTSGTGTPAWGTNPILATRYSYHATGGRLRHVIPPTKYRQMVNNGLNPDSASDSDLSAYAASEYEYGVDGRVSVFYTKGRRYTYSFNYHHVGILSSSLNAWAQRTNVTQPDGSLRSYYFNRVGQMMLEKVSNSATSPTKVWYARYQRFDDTSARRVLTTDAAAIASFSESLESLVTLNTSAGLLTQYIYNAQGYLEYTAIRKGLTGTANKQQEFTYTPQTVDGRSIQVVESETVYRDEASAGGITTSYGYLWHSGTFQMSRRTTTLPVVSTSENGRGATVTRVENFDSQGYLTSRVDERGTVTTYQYDKARGGLTQKVEDEGSGRLNLTTDYTLDYLGRTILERGPAHDVILASGSSANVRRAAWTYYKDREGERWDFQGYQTTGGSPVDQIVGPVTVTSPNLAPPSGYSGWRQHSKYDAIYGSSGIPAPTATFARSTWVRWKVGLFDKSAELKEERTYFDIPSSGEGAQSTNYGKKLFGYDSAGRLNQTTCAGGTIDKTTFNAMGWAITEELGTSAGLVVVESKEYDDDANLIKSTKPVDNNTANDRVTDYRYDWRHRLDESETAVENLESGGTWTLIEKRSYDNRGRVTSTTGYHTAVSNANRTSHSTSDYDVLGRPYRTKVYGVNASSGAISNPQESNIYYEPGGRVARNAPSGSALFSASTYDAVGRPKKSFQAYEPSGFTPGSNPASMTNAVVMEQRESDWDQASNRRYAISRSRFDTATANGELQNPGTAPQARASCMVSYADALGRVIATVNYGAKASASWTRPTTVPPRADDVLVNSTSYDAAGNATEMADPNDVKTTRTYDDSDRLITLVENATGSVPAKRTTHYEYTDDGWLRKLKCDNATTGQQVTEWVYGVTNGGGSWLNSNRLVRVKYYPDSTGAPDWEGFGYDRQQQVTFHGNQAGTNHVMNYDKLGRLFYDAAVAYGPGVDTATYAFGTSYNVRGLVSRRTTYSSSGVTNQVVCVYNDFNQLVTEYQEHSGSVNTSTSPKVQYSYENGSANTIRSTGITYPDGTIISTSYTSTQAGFLSRPDQVKEGSTVVASMRYLGLRTQVGLKYDQASNTEQTYENGGTGDAGDKYTGLDPFGRLVETIWKNSSNTKVQSSYGRNRMGGVTWRKDDKAHSLSVITQDNFHWYDNLQQVTRHDRGNLTPPGVPPYTGIDPTTRQQQENFTYDETGNWSAYQTVVPPDTQTRVHNKANEITSMTVGGSTFTPTYDPAGNMLTGGGLSYKWDAWNRVAEVTNGSYVTRYTYDAAFRCVTASDSSGTENFFYNQEWRAIQAGNPSTPSQQFVWQPGDRWTLVRRKHSVSSSLDQTRFCLRDGLDPVAIVDTSGAVVERFGYEAFGKERIMDPNFVTTGISTIGWNWLFHGEFQDLDTGLYNYGYRYYHPELGRWLSRDPLKELFGSYLYVFVLNEAVNIIDVLGLAGMPNKNYIDGGGHESDSERRKREARERELSSPKDCCGNPRQYYNIDTHCCEDGQIVAKRLVNGRNCCPRDILNDNIGYVSCVDEVTEQKNSMLRQAKRELDRLMEITWYEQGLKLEECNKMEPGLAQFCRDKVNAAATAAEHAWTARYYTQRITIQDAYTSGLETCEENFPCAESP